MFYSQKRDQLKKYNDAIERHIHQLQKMQKKFSPQLKWWLSTAHQTYHKRSQIDAQIFLQKML